MRECAYQYSPNEGCELTKAQHFKYGGLFSHYFCPFKIDPRVDKLIKDVARHQERLDGHLRRIDKLAMEKASILATDDRLAAIESRLSGVDEDLQAHEDRLVALEEKADTYRYKYTYVDHECRPDTWGPCGLKICGHRRKTICEHRIGVYWQECGGDDCVYLDHRTIEVKS